MGPAGKGFNERTRAGIEKPRGAARFRQPSTPASCQTPHPPPVRHTFTVGPTWTPPVTGLTAPSPHSSPPPSQAAEFVFREYQLNHLVSRLAVPHVALYRGLVFGGGAGISVHGSFRVATETSVFSMPETRIGMFPDVGASWFLPRLRHGGLPLGLYLGLTSARLTGYDLKRVGVATHFIPSDRLRGLEASLQLLAPSDCPKTQEEMHDMVHGMLTAAEAGPGEGEGAGAGGGVLQHRAQIEACFAAPTVAEIVQRLERDGSPWAHRTLKQVPRPARAWLAFLCRRNRVAAGAALENRHLFLRVFFFFAQKSIASQLPDANPQLPVSNRQ